jgi:ABC-type uncharacterized transport system permease subunit
MEAPLLTVTPSPAFWAAVGLYAIAAIGFLYGFLHARPEITRRARWVLIAGFAANGVDIGWRGVEGVHPGTSVREALGFLAWILTGGYLAASMKNRLELAGAVLTPISAVVLAAARLSPAGQPQSDLSLLGRIHISLATIGVAVFTLASALAAIYLLEQKNLKRKRFDSASFKTPGASLETLDAMARRFVLAGFSLFTVAIVLGMIWVEKRGTSMARFEYAAALLCWMTYAFLLGARAGLGWRGRRAAWITLAGFAAALTVLMIYFVRRAVGA